MRRSSELSRAGFGRVGVLLFISAASVALLVLAAVRGSSRPHLVLIVVDSLRADRVGAYGYELDTTPELDALASDGVRFARTVAPSSWCRPAVAAMLTSHHPRTLGIYEEPRHLLADRFETLAEILATAGYTTIGVTANPNLNSDYNLDQGFDRYTDSPTRYSWMGVGDAEARASSETPRAEEVLDRLLTEAREAGRGPVHLMANLMEIHGALAPGVDLSEFDDLFAGERTRRYLQATRLVSREVGLFVARLTALPGWEDTLFVIVGDHGQGLDSHPGVPRSSHHGLHLYESQVVVPFLLYNRADALPRGRVIEQPVRLLDVLPTVLELLDLEPPPGIAGTSLVPLITGEGSPPELPGAFVVESQFRGFDTIGLYLEGWKYFEHRKRMPGVDEYELQAEGPGENGTSTNRVLDQRVMGENLARLLRRWEEAHPAAEPTLTQTE